MTPRPARNTETFYWPETGATLRHLVTEHELLLADNGRDFVAPGIRVRPPLILPVDPVMRTVEAYVADLPEAPGRQLMVLLQAGAAALGLFGGGANLRTKSIKKYVVRGRGKAQPTHLKTGGKSRYGSRLRLQNARALLVEVNEKLNEWVDECGPPDHVFYSCPVRMWPDLFATTPEPPFRRDLATKIPMDLPVPTTEVLLRTYTAMSFGRIENLDLGE